MGEKNGWLSLRGDMREIRGDKGWERKSRNDAAAVGKKNLGERTFFKINLFIFGCVGSSLLHVGFL